MHAVAGFFSFALLFALIASGVPVGISLASVAFGSYACVSGLDQAISLLGLSAWSTTTDVVILAAVFFVLMGQTIYYSEIGSDLYNGFYRLLGRLPGGLAIATVFSCAAMGAVVGDSISTSATMGSIALPEMRRYGYQSRLAVGCIAAAGTLGVLIPPSLLLIAYGIITQESIGKLFIAGILPGIFSALLFVLMIYTRVKLNPTIAPIPPKTYTMKEKLKAMVHIIPVLCLFLLVLGGIYAGIFTPTEAGAVGAIGALLLTLAMGRLTVDRLKKILADSVRVSGMIMLIVIGAIYFSSYVSTTGLPVRFAEILTGLQVNRYVILSGIYLLYLFLGCLMTPLSIIFMTLPVIYPVIVKLGFDSIWFAIIVVKLCEMGCITPPVGLNVFVTRGVAPDVPIEEIFMGIGWFFGMDMVALILSTVSPDIVLWLPSIMMGS